MIYEQGIIANQGQLAQVDSGIRSMAVQVAELEGRTDAIGNPITRNEMQELVQASVTAEFPLQLPGMVSKELAVQKAMGALDEGMEIDRAYIEQSLQNTDEQRKSQLITSKQIDDAVLINKTKRDLNNAYKKAGLK